MTSVQQYLFSMINSRGLTRTLGEIIVCRDQNGNLCYSTGNSAVVFKIMHNGKPHALRCYTRSGQNLEAIYGNRLLRKELFVYRNNTHGEWVDVVLSEWVEGRTLHECIQHADRPEMSRLARTFDSLAAELLSDDCAHGDLKPENIIVREDGTMQPIDLDASFLPCMAGQQSPELGTAAFQHPARTATDFDARLDDFSVALICSALHALSLDPSLANRYHTCDMLLINPSLLPRDPAFEEILNLFERHGMAQQYRIARTLLTPTPHIPHLKKLFDTPTATPHPTSDLELFACDGLWGYRNSSGETIIAPLYDCGFDFTDSLAAVQIGNTWHYIDTSGRTIIRCPDCQAVKPFQNGKARLLHQGSWIEIGLPKKGNVLEY